MRAGDDDLIGAGDRIRRLARRDKLPRRRARAASLNFDIEAVLGERADLPPNSGSGTQFSTSFTLSAPDAIVVRVATVNTISVMIERIMIFLNDSVPTRASAAAPGS